MRYDGVLYEATGRIARVTMNRPEYRNAQSGPFLRAMDESFERAVADPKVRVMILAGEGEAFSAGHDLGTPEQSEELDSRRKDITDTEAQFDYSWDHFVQMSLRWRDLPKPTIAQIHGYCIFGGWLIASSMDLIVASDDAKFMTALLQYFTLPFDVGIRKAKELLFDSHTVSAQEALELGFVNKVVPRERLQEETNALAERIAESPSFYLRMVKTAVNQAQEAMGFKAAVQSAHAHYMLSAISNRQWANKQRREGKPTRDPEQERQMPLVRKILEREGSKASEEP